MYVTNDTLALLERMSAHLCFPATPAAACRVSASRENFSLRNANHRTDSAVQHTGSLRRGEKLRVIDDCNIAGLNFSVGLSEKFQLHIMDQLAAMVSRSLNRCDQRRHLKVYGRTYDLKSAYKQFPVSPADRNILRLAVQSPDGKEPRYFGVNGLPFGAIGSVAGFLRISHSLWFLGLAGLRFFWTAFYDGYSILTREELQVSAGRSCEGLLKLLASRCWSLWFPQKGWVKAP